MTTVRNNLVLKDAEAKQVLALENGDHLHSGEFLRRYEGMPDLKKAELIEGKVYMGSPVRADIHGEQDGIIHGWLTTYAFSTPGVKFYPNTTLLLDSDNSFQPDGMLCLSAPRAGRTRINDQGYLVGAAELVVEIAASSASIDLNEKLDTYRRCGVPEYLVWRTTEQRIDWFVLEDEDYRSMPADADGLIRSQNFPGLVLAVEALRKMDGSMVLAALKAGLESSAHTEFAKAANK